MGRKKGCIPWNKNLTKETDDRVKKFSEKVAIRNRERCFNKNWEQIFGIEK